MYHDILFYLLLSSIMINERIRIGNKIKDGTQIRHLHNFTIGKYLYTINVTIFGRDYKKKKRVGMQELIQQEDLTT